MGSNRFTTGYDTVNIPGGAGAEYELGKWQTKGPVLKPPTNASTINITGTAHDFNIDLNQAGVVVDGVPLNIDAAADVDLSSAADDALLADGESIIYCLVAWVSVAERTVRTDWVAGSIAVHASVARPTKAEIMTALGLSEDNPFFIVGETRLKCTGDTDLTQEINNMTAPLMVPDQVVPNLVG